MKRNVNTEKNYAVTAQWCPSSYSNAMARYSIDFLWFAFSHSIFFFPSLHSVFFSRSVMFQLPWASAVYGDVQCAFQSVRCRCESIHGIEVLLGYRTIYFLIRLYVFYTLFVYIYIFFFFCYFAAHNGNLWHEKRCRSQHEEREYFTRDCVGYSTLYGRTNKNTKFFFTFVDGTRCHAARARI